MLGFRSSGSHRRIVTLRTDQGAHTRYLAFEIDGCRPSGLGSSRSAVLHGIGERGVLAREERTLAGRYRHFLHGEVGTILLAHGESTLAGLLCGDVVTLAVGEHDVADGDDIRLVGMAIVVGRHRDAQQDARVASDGLVLHRREQHGDGLAADARTHRMAVLTVGHRDDTVVRHGERQGDIKLCRHHLIGIVEGNGYIHRLSHVTHDRVNKQAVVCLYLCSRPSRECRHQDEGQEA